MRRPFERLPIALLLVLVAACTIAILGPASGGGSAQPRPDGAGTVWLCRPGQQPDPCAASLATTVIEPNGSRHIVHYQDSTNPPVDCFYLYPNITHQHSANANLDIDPQEAAIAELEASPFSQVCRVFAPMYREATGEGSGNARAVAYASALEAWRDYLADYNDGRGVVLIGHSEGSSVLSELLTKQIVLSPQVRAQVVSAVLTGLDFPVLSLTDLVPCESPDQIGCIVDFNAYSGTPPSDAYFGDVPPVDGKPVEDICTNPANFDGRHWRSGFDVPIPARDSRRGWKPHRRHPVQARSGGLDSLDRVCGRIFRRMRHRRGATRPCRRCEREGPRTTVLP